MKANTYQRLAMRTNDGNNTERLINTMMSVFQSGDDSRGYIDIGALLDASVGLPGEVGEFDEEIKKWIFHGKPLDREHLLKELGDVLWYVAMACTALGVEMSTVMKMNIDKLEKRYPNGFDEARANNRSEEDH